MDMHGWGGMRRGRPGCGVMLASRQYLQGEATRQHQPNPLSLDGRGIKGEGDSETVPPHRHSRVGGKPQGGRVGCAAAGPGAASYWLQGSIYRVEMWDCLVFTLTFDSSPIKGEGEYVVGVGLLSAVRHPSGLRIKSAMTGRAPAVINQCRFGASAWARRTSRRSPQLASYG